MTNVVDIRTREGVSATRPGVSGEAREAVFQLLCPYGVTVSMVDLFLALLWSQGFRVERVPGPPGPCDNRDFPRFMRETSEWVEANKAADAADRRTERVSLAIHLTGLALVVGAMLWVAL